jgi:hypothetical protein
MMMPTLTVEELQTHFKSLRGLRCVQAYRGFGTSVIFDFGELLIPTDGGRPIGQFDLWIAGASWRLDRRSMTIAGSLDDDGVVDVALAKMIGRVVIATHVAEDRLDPEIEFDSGESLRVFRNSSSADHWTLFVPGASLFISEHGQILSEIRD